MLLIYSKTRRQWLKKLTENLLSRNNDLSMKLKRTPQLYIRITEGKWKTLTVSTALRIIGSLHDLTTDAHSSANNGLPVFLPKHVYERQRVFMPFRRLPLIAYVMMLYCGKSTESLFNIQIIFTTDTTVVVEIGSSSKLCWSSWWNYTLQRYVVATWPQILLDLVRGLR